MALAAEILDPPEVPPLGADPEDGPAPADPEAPAAPAPAEPEPPDGPPDPGAGAAGVDDCYDKYAYHFLFKLYLSRVHLRVGHMTDDLLLLVCFCLP